MGIWPQLTQKLIRVATPSYAMWFGWEIIIRLDTTFEVGGVVDSIGLEFYLLCEFPLLKKHATVKHPTAAGELWEMEGSISFEVHRNSNSLLPGLEEKPLRLQS